MPKCNSDLQYEDVKPELEEILDLYLEDEPTKSEIVSHLLSYIEELVKDEKTDLESSLDDSYGDTCDELEDKVDELESKLEDIKGEKEVARMEESFYKYA